MLTIVVFFFASKEKDKVHKFDNIYFEQFSNNVNTSLPRAIVSATS